MQQEEAAHQVMTGTATYKIEGDTLTIAKDDTVLVLTRGTPGSAQPSASSPATLTGTWKLSAVQVEDVATSALAGAEAKLTFNEDSTVTGTSGCNEFGGGYTVEGDQITFKDIVSTLMACDTPIMQQEEAFQQILAETAMYKIDGDTLTITKDNRSLVLERQ